MPEAGSYLSARFQYPFPQVLFLVSEPDVARILSEKRALDARLAGTGGAEALRALSFLRELEPALELEEELQKKIPKIESAAFETKKKFAGQLRKGGKALARLERKLGLLHAEGRLRQEDARKLAGAVLCAQKADFAGARRELAWFSELKEIDAGIARAEAGIAGAEEALSREQKAIESRLAEAAELESERVDGERASGFLRLAEGERAYAEWRLSALAAMKRKPLLSLMRLGLGGGMPDALGFPQARPDSLEALCALVSSQSGLAGLDAQGLESLARLSPARLSHSMGDSARFVSLMRENAEWVSAVSRLESTQFLQAGLAEPGRAREIRGFLSKAEMPRVAREFLEGLSKLDFAEVEAMRAEHEKSLRLAALREKAGGAGKEVLERRLAEVNGMLSRLGQARRQV
jgi:hypothetical protein